MSKTNYLKAVNAVLELKRDKEEVAAFAVALALVAQLDDLEMKFKDIKETLSDRLFDDLNEDVVLPRSLVLGYVVAMQEMKASTYNKHHDEGSDFYSLLGVKQYFSEDLINLVNNRKMKVSKAINLLTSAFRD